MGTRTVFSYGTTGLEHFNPRSRTQDQKAEWLRHSGHHLTGSDVTNVDVQVISQRADVLISFKATEILFVQSVGKGGYVYYVTF